MKINKKDLIVNPKVSNRLPKINVNPKTAAKHRINTYDDAREFVKGCSGGNIELGLENVRNLLDKLNNPQESQSIIHVAGTNGKGSTIAFLKSIFEKAGLKVGCFTSPAVFSYEEMFYANKEFIKSDEYTEIVAEVAEKYDELINEGRYSPTTFEVEVAIAFLFFKMKRCDVVIIETGMGGSLDATNIIARPVCSVITSISMDHSAYLGNNLKDIAKAKAGIIKFGLPCFSAVQKDEVKEVLEEVAKDRLTTVKFVEEDENIDVNDFNLKGTFQCSNASLAKEVAIYVFESILGNSYLGMKDYFDEIINSGLKEAINPGRFEKIKDNPIIILDGAHNEDAALKLSDSIDKYFKDRNIYMIMGILKDKDYKRISEILANKAKSINVVRPHNSRGLDCSILEEEVSKYCNDTKSFESYEDAVKDIMGKNTDDGIIVICGTLSFLGEIKEIINCL